MSSPFHPDGYHYQHHHNNIYHSHYNHDHHHLHQTHDHHLRISLGTASPAEQQAGLDEERGVQVAEPAVNLPPQHQNNHHNHNHDHYHLHHADPQSSPDDLT